MNTENNDEVFDQVFSDDKAVKVTKKPDSAIDVDSEEVTFVKSDTDDEQQVIEQADKITEQELLDKEIEEKERDFEQLLSDEQSQQAGEAIDDDEIEDDGEYSQTNRNSKLIKIMLGVSVVSIALGAGGLFTAISALGNANAINSSIEVTSQQLSTLKTSVASMQQVSSKNAGEIVEVKAGLNHAHESNLEYQQKLSDALSQISKLQNQQVKQNGINSDFEQSLSSIQRTADSATSAVKVVEKKLAKQLAVARKAATVSSVSPVATGNTQPHTMKHYTHKRNTVEHVNEFNGIRLASIDGWDGAYSATLTTPDNQFKVVNPGYLINGYLVKKITAHNLYLESPSGRKMVMEQ
ncbi:hypothetical protein [Photobacterium leiognathi]|uniref:hypothetical protein n=1 Tax=Photobacterium leiognathi TaxID=553611 RepID=UPI0029820A61|nr:hypothetical protein [Photobacterium leiognathi]